MTLWEIITWGRERLKEAGIPSPQADIQWIVSEVTHFNRVHLSLNKQLPLSDKQEAKITEYVARRCTREPLQYVLGNQSFMDLQIKTDRRALIPRPETELLAERVISLIKEEFPANERFEMMDLCTGTGALALAITQKCDNVYTVAGDISEEALSLAKENIARYSLQDRITPVCADLFEGVKGRKFHGIVTNPPYIASGAISSLMPEVALFEPHLALDGGTSGFDFYERILTQASEHLYSGGFLAMEAEHYLFFPIAELSEKLGTFSPPVYIPDYSGLNRACYIKKL